jgi:hypothetical protein
MPEQSKWTSVNNGVIHKIDTVLKLVVKIKDGKGKGKGNGKSMEMGQRCWARKRHGYGYGQRKARGRARERSWKGKGKGVSEDTVADFILKDPDLTPLTAVSRAGLVDALMSLVLYCVRPKQWRVRAIPADTLDTLLNNDEFIPHLTNLLLSTTSRLGSCCQKL